MMPPPNVASSLTTKRKQSEAKANSLQSNRILMAVRIILLGIFDVPTLIFEWRNALT